MKSGRYSRRQALRTFAGGVVAVAAAACVPFRTAPLGDNPAPGAASPAALRKGGVLILGQTTIPPTTDPFPSNPAVNAAKWAVFNPLVSLDARKQPIPALAESWTMSDDRLTVQFRLRDGVVFHSGRPLTADAVKWNIERAQDPKNQLAVGGELKGVEARPLGARMLELRLPEVAPHIFSLLASVLIADPESDITRAAAGTGAFRVDGLEQGNEMRLLRNTAYWRADRPHLDGVTIKAMPDTQAAVVALETGYAHAVWCTANDVERLKAGVQTTAVTFAGSGSFELLMSAVDPPFTDKRVRQAIGFALDRQRFASTVMRGLTRPTHTLWVRNSPVWDASIDIGEFNLDRARQLLTEAGYPNGFETKLLVNSTYPELPPFAQILQADLATIDVRASIEPLDGVQTNTVTTQGKLTSMILHSYAYGDQDPAMQFTAFVFRPEGNASRFDADDYKQLVQAARRERDWDTRIALYRRISGFLQDAAIVHPLANGVVSFGVRSNVNGFVRQPAAPAPDLEEISLA